MMTQQQAEMKPDLVYLPHPLTGEGRRLAYSTICEGESLANYFARQALVFDDAVLYLNGRLIAEERWPTTFLKRHDLITLRPRLQDGGMSQEQTKTLRTVLTIAVLAYAGQVGGAYGVLISLGGTYAINELFPFPEADNSDDDSSPNYSLRGASNRARPYSPLQLVAGVHRMYPDIGAATYTEFEGEDQYLNMVFHFGISDLVLSGFKLGDTLLTEFDDYQLEESGADGALSLFPANVDSLAGGVLDEASGWITRTSSIDATALVFDLTGYLYRTSEGELKSHTVTVQIQYRAVGDVTWLDFGNAAGGEYVLSNSDRTPLRWSKRQAVASGQYEVQAQRVSADETNSAKVSSISWSQLKTFQPDSGDYTGQKRVALRVRAGGQFNGQVDQFNAMASAQVPVFNDPDWTTEISSNPGFQLLALARGIRINSKLVAGAGLADSKIDIESLKSFAAWCDASGLECDLIIDQAMNCLQMLNTIARCGRAAVTWSNGILGVIWDAPGLPVTAVFGMQNIRRNTFKVNYNTGPLPDFVVVNFTNPDLGYKQDSVRVAVTGAAGDGREHTVTLLGCTSAVQAGREANLMAAAFEHRRRQVEFDTDLEGAVVQRGDVVQLSHELASWDKSGRLLAGSNTQLTLDNPVIFEAGYQHYIGLRYPNGDYDIYDVVAQLGEATVIELTSPLVKAQWTASTAKTNADEVEPTLFNGFYYEAQNSASTGASEPVWPSLLGGSVLDGGVTWLCTGEAREYAPDDDTDSDGPVDYLWFFGADASPGKRAKVLDVTPVGLHTLRLTLTDDDAAYYASEYNGYDHAVVNNADNAPVVSDLDVKDTLIKSGTGYAVIIALSWDVLGDYGGAIVRAAPNGEALKVVDNTTDRSSQFAWPVPIGSIDIEVTLLNSQGIPNIGGKASTTYSIEGADIPISDVTNFTANRVDFGVELNWDDVLDAHLYDYEIRLVIGGVAPTTADWETAETVTRLLGSSYSVPVVSAGVYHYMIRARDANTRTLSVNAAVASLTINAPSQPVVSNGFAGENVVLIWSASVGEFAISDYKIYYGSDFASAIHFDTLDALSTTLKAQWLGERTFWIEPIDVAGNAGGAGSVTVAINPGVMDSLQAEVIDNNVLFRWAATAGTLPVAGFELRKGAVFATAEVLGLLSGTFASHFENQSGQYRYWMVPIDTAGNYGAEISVLENVDEPPDFILHKEWLSDYSGTLSNVFQMQDGNLILPVNTTESWTEHFVNNAWASPQDQIDAGFPFYMEPSVNTAFIEQEFDYGTNLSGTLITLLLDSTVLDGAVTITPTISVKKLIGDAWTDYPGTWQQYALDFRYVKFKLEFAATGGDDQLQVNSIKLKLAVKQKTEAGSGAAVSTDVGGTVYAFTKGFVDVESISVTPKGTTPVIAIYDFVDAPYPTECKVLLFDENGVRVSGDFSIAIEGF